MPGVCLESHLSEGAVNKMRKYFCPRLAFQNLGKNRSSYFSYMITCVITIAMFYIMSALATASDLDQLYGLREVRAFLSYGQWIVGIFAFVFLFYTHSFILKRRKKELGLYNILGMEKKHIALVLFLETLYCALITLILGLFFGILLYRASQLFLMKLVHLESIPGGFLSPGAAASTVFFFGILFFLTFLNTLRQIGAVSPIELLKGSQVGEKEPKAKILLVIGGIACLGGGYYISITATSPMETVGLFFFAVILVILGTYALFTSVTIAFLKFLRRRKKYYYTPRHFTFISGMLYRMKQNAVGLANICILSTMVLVMLSTSILLYVSIGDQQRTNYPRNIEIDINSINTEDIPAVEAFIDQTVADLSVSAENLQRFHETSLLLFTEGNRFYFDINVNAYSENGTVLVNLLTLADYNRLTGENLTLENADDIYLVAPKDSFQEDTLVLENTSLHIQKRIPSFEIADGALKYMVDTYYIIAKDDAAVQALRDPLAEKYGDVAFTSYVYAFDVDGNDDAQIACKNALTKAIFDSGLVPVSIEGSITSVAESTDSYYQLYGGLLFIGIFLGILFLMATVLIIYYKQMTEGYEDQARFEIMQHVGMSRQEVRGTIKTQVLSVFFLPLGMACVHTAFAFPIITRLLALLMMNNTSLYIIGLVCTIGVFALFYTIVYLITARVYHKIVAVKML